MTNNGFTRAQAWAMFAAGAIANTVASRSAPDGASSAAVVSVIADQMLTEFDERFPEYSEVRDIEEE
jgi:hypothetical protein